MVLVPRVDNKVQAVRCHSMTKVTADFLMYNVTNAIQEVKADHPLNKLLQNCRVPEIIAGEVDCLMVITCLLLHPDPLHTLPTPGLSIYATKLKSHNVKMNAMIGGSHESFKLFSALAGRVQIQSFQAGLQRFRYGAMPRILGNLSTFEEEVEGLEELLGEDGLFEEYGVEEVGDVVMEWDCCGEDTTLTTEVLTHDSPSHNAANASMAGKVGVIRSDPPEVVGEDIADHNDEEGEAPSISTSV